MHIVVAAVCALSVINILLGGVNIFIGVIMSVQSDVWMAHCISPLWSGAFFVITGVLGFACARQKTAYMILCFGAISIIDVIAAVVSVQLLRLGLVNHTTDGQTFQKEEQDILIILAIVIASTQALVDFFNLTSAWRFMLAVKSEVFKKREGTFHIQILGEKDILVITTGSKRSKIEKKRLKEAQKLAEKKGQVGV